MYSSWRQSNTFGEVQNYQTIDYKSSLYSSLQAHDLMVKDEHGWVSYTDVFQGSTFLR
eukprot:UN13615